MKEQFAVLLYPAPEEAINPAYATIVAPFYSEAAAVTYAEENKGDGMFEAFVMTSPKVDRKTKLNIDVEMLGEMIEEFDEQNLYGQLLERVDDLLKQVADSNFLNPVSFEYTCESLSFLQEQSPDALEEFLKRELGITITEDGSFSFAPILTESDYYFLVAESSEHTLEGNQSASWCLAVHRESSRATLVQGFIELARWPSGDISQRLMKKSEKTDLMQLIKSEGVVEEPDDYRLNRYESAAETSVFWQAFIANLFLEHKNETETARSHLKRI
jgi:hypothetical protein